MRATYKAKYIVPVAPEMARSLRDKFENWTNEIDRENNNANLNNKLITGLPDVGMFKPSVDTARNLKMKFESIKYETNNSKPLERPKMRVNRFVVSFQSLCSKLALYVRKCVGCVSCVSKFIIHTFIHCIHYFANSNGFC